MNNPLKIVTIVLDFCSNFGIIRSMKTLLSVNEAAEAMGISGRRVLKLLAEGRIQGTKVGGRWLVTKLGYKTKKRGFPKRK